LYGGEQILDFTFIDDTVLGILDTFDQVCEKNHDLYGDALHFVTGRGVSVSQLAHMIVDEVTSSSNIITIAPKRFDVHKFVGDPSKAYQTIGYQPTTTLEDGLRILKEKILRTR
jgi:nucleoside-diphosphate-sugar epimerase